MQLQRMLTAWAVIVAGSQAAAWAHPEAPGAPQDGPIALVGATVHPVSGPPIENGIVLFDEGRIVAVGADLTIPDHAERIDATGKRIYPALIDACSQLGLVEISAVRATRDQSETGTVNPNVKAQVAVNPDSELIPVTRSNGVLVAHIAPSGGVISGQSAVMALDGWTWEDMTILPGAAMRINWPRMQPVDAWWVEQSASEQMADRNRSLETLNETFETARAYDRALHAHEAGQGDRPAFDIRWEAMRPALAGKQPVMVEADELQEIQAAVAFAEQQGLKMILLGGYDAPRCAELLKSRDIPVIIGGTQRLPRRRNDDYDAPFRVASELHKAGLRYCICNPTAGSAGSSDANARNLPYHAAAAAAAGLPPDEALRSITIHAAEILGVADRLGSLEPGKDATLIVTDGDPLEIATHVEAAYVGGREVNLNNRHKRLWEKYKEKYRRMGIEN